MVQLKNIVNGVKMVKELLKLHMNSDSPPSHWAAHRSCECENLAGFFAAHQQEAQLLHNKDNQLFLYRLITLDNNTISMNNTMLLTATYGRALTRI